MFGDWIELAPSRAPSKPIDWNASCTSGAIERHDLTFTASLSELTACFVDGVARGPARVNAAARPKRLKLRRPGPSSLP